MFLSLQFSALRTRELHELLQDEDKIKHIITCTEKVQGLHRAAEKMLLSNQKLAKVALSQKTTLRDNRLLLAMKYMELEKLRFLIQAKQEQLAEKHSLQYSQWCLLQRISHAEEECEMLFKKFLEGKIHPANFLDSFLGSRKLQHIKMFLVKKLQEMFELQSTQQHRLSEIQPNIQVLNACSLNTAYVLPACCHPLLLMPLGAHVPQCIQHLPPFCLDYDKPLRAGGRGRGAKWPARPVRLQPLLQQKRHQQAPP